MGLHQGSGLSSFLIAVLLDIDTVLRGEISYLVKFSELLYFDSSVLMSETIDGLMNKFKKWGFLRARF